MFFCDSMLEPPFWTAMLCGGGGGRGGDRFLDDSIKVKNRDNDVRGGMPQVISRKEQSHAFDTGAHHASKTDGVEGKIAAADVIVSAKDNNTNEDELMLRTLSIAYRECTKSPLFTDGEDRDYEDNMGDANSGATHSSDTVFVVDGGSKTNSGHEASSACSSNILVNATNATKRTATWPEHGHSQHISQRSGIQGKERMISRGTHGSKTRRRMREKARNIDASRVEENDPSDEQLPVLEEDGHRRRNRRRNRRHRPFPPMTVLTSIPSESLCRDGSSRALLPPLKGETPSQKFSPPMPPPLPPFPLTNDLIADDTCDQRQRKVYRNVDDISKMSDLMSDEWGEENTLSILSAPGQNADEENKRPDHDTNHNSTVHCEGNDPVSSFDDDDDDQWGGYSSAGSSSVSVSSVASLSSLTSWIRRVKVISSAMKGKKEKMGEATNDSVSEKMTQSKNKRGAWGRCVGKATVKGKNEGKGTGFGKGFDKAKIGQNAIESNNDMDHIVDMKDDEVNSDGSSGYSSPDTGSGSSTTTDTTLSISQSLYSMSPRTRQRINNLWVQIFYDEIKPQDHFRVSGGLLKVYKRCFVGKDVVDMLSTKFQTSRASALRLGRIVNSQLDLFESVHETVNDLEDDDYFYRFKKRRRRRRRSSSPSESEDKGGKGGARAA